MKHIFFIFNMVFYFNAMAKQDDTTLRVSNADTIYWTKDYKLKASDFKAFPEPGARVGALSSTSITYDYYLDSLNELHFNVYCYFNCNDSWISVVDAANIYGLAHEQLHFDIAELFVRIIKNNLIYYTRQGKVTEEGCEQIIQNLLNETTTFRIYTIKKPITL